MHLAIMSHALHVSPNLSMGADYIIAWSMPGVGRW
jgi:hypothetical protein